MCRLYCDLCDYGQDMEARCQKHPLIYGMGKQMHQAMVQHRLWGNIVLHEESALIARMNNKELKALQAKKDDAEKKSNADLKSYIIQKKLQRFCSDGKLKQKFSTKCTDQGEEGGCWAHAVGACPYIHAGEESLYDFGGKRMLMLIAPQQNHSQPMIQKKGYRSSPLCR